MIFAIAQQEENVNSKNNVTEKKVVQFLGNINREIIYFFLQKTETWGNEK